MGYCSALSIRDSATITGENISDYVKKSFDAVNVDYQDAETEHITARFFRRRDNETVDTLIVHASTLRDKADKQQRCVRC